MPAAGLRARVQSRNCRRVAYAFPPLMPRARHGACAMSVAYAYSMRWRAAFAIIPSAFLYSVMAPENTAGCRMIVASSTRRQAICAEV